jgi:hypothetical protein
MPFKSEAQRAYLYATHPEIAKRFQEETPKCAKLPEHVPSKGHPHPSRHGKGR